MQTGAHLRAPSSDVHILPRILNRATVGRPAVIIGETGPFTYGEEFVEGINPKEQERPNGVPAVLAGAGITFLSIGDMTAGIGLGEQNRWPFVVLFEK